MKKVAMKKLRLTADTLAILSSTQLEEAVGGAYTDALGCVETQPMSFCICPTKYICTINC
jgi:hypothetical protein